MPALGNSTGLSNVKLHFLTIWEKGWYPVWKSFWPAAAAGFYFRVKKHSKFRIKIVYFKYCLKKILIYRKNKEICIS
jgi:hypothetical protein